jgi:type I restriction enzyme S subunit
MTGTTKPSGIPWIGEIPVDWETDEIRYKFKQVKSLNFRGDEDNLLSLSYGRIIQKDMESAFGLLPESFDTYNIIENGDIVLRLTDLQNDQKSLRVGFSEQRGIITSAYLTLRLAGEGHAKFFYYLIHAYDLQKVFYGMGAGVRQGLNWDELKRASVIFPDKTEQKEIADYLDAECDRVDEMPSLQI